MWRARAWRKFLLERHRSVLFWRLMLCTVASQERAYDNLNSFFTHRRAQPAGVKALGGVYRYILQSGLSDVERSRSRVQTLAEGRVDDLDDLVGHAAGLGVVGNDLDFWTTPPLGCSATLSRTSASSLCRGARSWPPISYSSSVNCGETGLWRADDCRTWRRCTSPRTMMWSV